MKKLLLLGLLLLPIKAMAIEATVTATEVVVEYDEPLNNIPNIDGDVTPLTDLDHTTVYYDKGSGPVNAVEVPATSLNGGGHIIQPISIPVAELEEANISIWATATDTSGNESDPSNTVTKRIDRLKPQPPQ